MGCASIKINPGGSHMSENWEGPDSEDKRRRAERRWKRRELISNESLKHNRCAGATRITVKSRGNMAVLKNNNGHMVEDEVDEDYKMFLDTYVSRTNVVSDNNVDGSDIDVDNSDSDDDSDPQYKMFLENLREEGNSYVVSFFVKNQLVHIRYEDDDDDHEEEEEEEKEEEERLRDELKLDTKMLKGLTQRDKTGNLGTTGSDSIREKTVGPMKSQQSLETERRLCNKRPRQDVSSVPKNSCHNQVEFDDVDEDYQLFLNSCRIDGDSLVYAGSELNGKSSGVRQNSQFSDQAFDTSEVNCDDIDEDYQLFLNSARIVDGNLVYMCDRNITKTDKVEGGSYSSDPDLILLEPNQICENTPFISSKSYHSSWFENEANPRDSRQFSGYHHSQFRRRLMEYLEKPYDQEEYDAFLHEVHRQRQKEKHKETRQGVVKSCLTHGVNESYLELYPDLAKAIAEFKEPHRVLFLLRGFIFWLQNLTHEGIFRPWLDESCLEILRKM